MPTLLEKAIRIAVNAHAGQKDKAGAPYVLHPLRVMMKMGSDREMIAAVLHDVIEDTTCTLDTLRREGFPAEIITALDHLTRRQAETYADFINRVKENGLALKVKLADLEDNMNTGRLPLLTDNDRRRLARYREAATCLGISQRYNGDPAEREPREHR
jgi:(p)ppGpp synthase/HD superfamily hydrolase